MTELKPCPFCGGEGCIPVHVSPGDAIRFGVVCLDCGCETRQFYETEAEAIEAWNNRTGEQDG